MGSDSAGDQNQNNHQDHHTIKIWEVNEERLTCMKQKINTPPKLLAPSSGQSSCCIFRVPQSLVEINGTSYQPRIVSIGPYHYSDPNLQMIQEHKWRYLGSLLTRTRSKGVELEHYLKSIALLEEKARECYSETIHFTTDEFIEILVLDGCFIIEIFRKMKRLIPFEPGDPLVSMSWILPFFYRDFLRLENQIPYFVLQTLFDLTKMPGEENGPTLSTLALEFFNYGMLRPDEHIDRFSTLEGTHLLDLCRNSFIPVNLPEPRKRTNLQTQSIQNVSKLRSAGIKLKPGKGESFLVAEFKRGVLEMPTITIDDFYTSFLLNCVAFEQCHKNSTKHMTTYTTLLDCLVNSARDVEHLTERNIIENYYGTDGEVARFINNMGKDVAFDIEKCYLTKLFNDVNEYYQNGWHVQWASFKYTYFDTPWSFISALAAFVLLLLTMAQTFFTVFPYFRPPH
ncbi:Protein of unknown function DUF247, plant [Dillenia turbinata]|uniref:Uncharacterized protein n=1 Tax=Dillenia turbinata TaxID=194707 RepID=A0AAN8ZM84_9MAGN